MNLYLTGYRGSGKSTVGKLLKELLEWDFLDTDEEIESVAGKSICQIFESVGEAGFRQLESRVISEAAELDKFVVSLGGGAVLADANRQAICESGSAVWLKISPETSLARINADQKSTSQRPNLTQTGGIAEIEQMMAARSPIYQSIADLIVEADFKSPSEIAAAIFDYFRPKLLR